MRTLIVYASRYGFTYECVNDIKNAIRGKVDCYDVQEEKLPILQDYDNVVLGSSIFIGQIDKRLKNYIQQYLGELLNKRLFLYLSCGISEQFEQNLNHAFPKELLDKAILKTCFGGELRLEKMKFADKIMTKMMLKATEKQGKTAPCRRQDNIQSMVEAINRIV